MADTCSKCKTPLTMTITPDSDSETDMTPETTVPDDVKLPCTCHFHWECLLDTYDLSQCPNCSSYILTSPVSASESSSREAETQRLIVDLHNEGGMQEGIDILPILKEEVYLRAYPEERKCRAFLEFCREGDVGAIVDLLQTCDEEPDDDEEAAGEGRKTRDEILRYQDPIGEMASGLHAAAANGQREVAWLLLLLASRLPELEIPALVFQEAASLGIMREEQEGKTDIRGLRDAAGRTAEDVAREMGVIWNGWIGNARLSLP